MPPNVRPRLVWRKLRPGEFDHERAWSLLFLLGVGLAFAIPESLRFAIPCPWKRLTHLPCLGCGSNRALSALTALNLPQAWHYNPMITASLLAWGAFSLYALIVMVGRLPRLRPEGSWRRWRWPLATILLALLGAHWVYLWSSGI